MSSTKVEEEIEDEEIPVSLPSFTPAAAAPYTCFVKGTLVTMATGATRPIEEIGVGDSVLSYNFKLKQVEAVPVLEIIKPVHNKTAILTFVGTRGVFTNQNTVEHPYYIVNKGCWGAVEPGVHGVRSVKLSIGDKCLSYFRGISGVFSVSNCGRLYRNSST